MNTYGKRTTTLTRGQGAYVWDDKGRRYLDALSGIAVCGLGHCHPAVTRAIAEQADTLLHVSNLYNIEPQISLGEKLIDLSGMENVFFSNSGTEANEAAIKIARKFGNDQGIESPSIITTHNSFHGRTMAALSATGNAKVKAGFEPLLSGFVHADYNDIDAIIAAANENTVAVMVEPIQGEGGIRVPDTDYLIKLRTLCDQRGWLLILDEIQSGNGRSGCYFAFQHSDIVPDVLTTAKGLGNGVPIGACLAKGAAANVLQAGNHGSTFGGNPLACRAALTCIETIEKEGLLARATALGNLFLTEFKERLANESRVKSIRGVGLLIGIEVDADCTHAVEKAKDAGILINVTAGNTIRLLPPLILTDSQAYDIINAICQLVTDLSKQEDLASKPS